jgi:uncharacterized membrane protein
MTIIRQEEEEMAFCSHCGSPVSGNFCGSCGKPVEPPAAGQPQAPTPPTAAVGELADNLASALCYIPAAGLLISIVFLVVAPYSQKKRIRFDAFQSIGVHVAWAVAAIIINALLPWHVAYRLDQLLHLACVILLVFMMWKAYQNEKVVLPVIGPIADKQA